MLENRKRWVHWLFETTQRLYLRFKKKQPWNIHSSQLMEMSKHTFGYQLGLFLRNNAFELIPKVERHDAYHVLSGFPTGAEDEIALQYLCFGNGKRTPYLFAVLVIGTLLLPEYATYYRHSFLLGKRSNSFHHFDYKTVLPLDFDTFRTMIFSEETLAALEVLQQQKTLTPIKTPVYEE
ncbi:MAG: hypothetical protein AAF466_11560 [Bacteroidota bacterium]